MAENKLDMKKISIITPEFGKGKGGIQNWMYYLYKFLDCNDFDLAVYAYREDNFFVKFAKLFKSDVYMLATWKMSIFVFPFILFKKRKIFIFVHGDEILNLNFFKLFWIKRLARDDSISWIANSQAISELFLKEIKLEVDFIQPPFLDTKVDSFKKLKNSKPKFFTISRLVKRKNIDNTIKALYELAKEDFEFSYIKAGDGVEREKLVNLVKNYSMQDKIQIVGKIDEVKKDRLLKECDYFLLPSLFDKYTGSIEGYGIVFIEANAYGVAVLSGNTGGMLEAVKQGLTGYHCDGSIEDIKLNIIKLMQTNFDKNIIVEHANKHHYENQMQFLNFIIGEINEC